MIGLGQVLDQVKKNAFYGKPYKQGDESASLYDDELMDGLGLYEWRSSEGKFNAEGLLSWACYFTGTSRGTALS